jgi:hypothetical protein
MTKPFAAMTDAELVAEVLGSLFYPRGDPLACILAERLKAANEKLDVYEQRERVFTALSEPEQKSQQSAPLAGAFPTGVTTI